MPATSTQSSSTTTEGRIYTVKRGDDLESIAFECGYFWESIWDDPENQALRELRKDHQVLFEGDQVFIRTKKISSVACASGMTHQFIRKGVPAKLILIIKKNDIPRANQPYTIYIDGKRFEGETDGDGRLERSIPPNAKKAELTVGPEGNQSNYILQLGYLDPDKELFGVQERLSNLGYFPGKLDGKMSPMLGNAIRRFQRAMDLEETGEIDQQTLDELIQLHKS